MKRLVRMFVGSSFLTTIPLLLFLCAFFWGLNANYPLLGHDYFYFFPRMLAGKWHYLSQGFAPFRYSPHFCGGFPMYGNPHDVFYSLPQVLSLFLGLWTSVQLSIAVALIAGYAGWVRFGSDVLRLQREWSHVLALLILSSGYYFMHMIAGHLSYHTLPLMGWFLWFLFDRSQPQTGADFLPALPALKSAVFALLTAYVFYSAGYFVLILTGTLFLLFLPLDLVFLSTNPRERMLQILKKFFLYGGAALLLCISKLVAIYSLMRFLPRTVAFDQFPEGSSGLAFILKSFFVFPQGSFLLDPGQNTWGMHEYSMFLSPLVLIGLFAGIVKMIRTDGATNKKIFLACYVLLLLAFFAELARGHGLLVDWLKVLPLLSSIRVTVRFLYVPAVLLCIGSVFGLSKLFTHHRLRNYTKKIVPVAGILVPLFFLFAYGSMLFGKDLELSMPYQQVQEQIASSGYLTKSVSRIQAASPDMSGDLEHLFSASTSSQCYEPLLNDAKFLKPLPNGPIAQAKDGVFNIHNPACLQYPQENSCQPGDQIKEEDKANLVSFLNGLPVTWTLSLAQKISDAMTVISLLLSVGLLGWFGIQKILKRDGRARRWWNTRNFSGLNAGIASAFLRGRTLLLGKSPGSPDAFRRFLNGALAVIGLAFVAYICAFKILDRDFWWHITAGKIMWQTKDIIHTEPFAYTRWGQPYLANHEWLAQIILYLLYTYGNAAAVILFRTAAMMATLAFILLIDTRRLWLFVPLAVLAANAMRPSFIERPQLFTFIIFSAGLLLTFRILETLATRSPRRREWIRSLLIFVLLQILWVNTHGGAALVGLIFPGILFLDRLWERYRTAPAQRKTSDEDLRWILGLGAALVLGLLVSPITYQNITYVWNLLNDRTIIYISEWRPREFGSYLSLIAPFWIIGPVSLACGRRNVIASAVLLVAMGFLSAKAMRHEVLFIGSSVAVTIHQLRHSPQWQRMIDWLLMRRIFTTLTLFILLFGLVRWYVHVEYLSFTQPDQLQGYGQFDFGKSAVDFLEQENVQGKMFNTYGFGGYLIYRGTPDRHVFIDGRNVDHGFVLMNLTYLAGTDPLQWAKLEEKYGFTYAVVDYPANTDEKKKEIQYAAHLDTNSAWPLVYLDDWVAIYLKDVPENQPVIRKWRYHLVSTSRLQFKSLLDDVPQTQWPALETELRHAIESDTRSIKARITLGKMLVRQKRFDEAHVIIEDTLIVRPNDPEPHALLGALFVGKEQWKEAADAFETAVDLAGKNYPDMDYGLLAQVFAKADRMSEARFYARKAGKELILRDTTTTSETIVPSGQSAPAEGSVPMVNPAQDSIDFHDLALSQAQAGNLVEARKNFLNALKLNPRFAQAWNNLGTLSFNEGKLDEAKGQYERAIVEWPEYPDAHYNLALLLINMGDLKNAKLQIAEAKKLGKDTTTLEEYLRTKQ